MVPMKVMCALFLLALVSAYAQSPGSGDFTSRGVISTPGLLKKLMDVPDVKAAYEACKTKPAQAGCFPSAAAGAPAAQPPASSTGDNSLLRPECQKLMSDCVWAELGPAKQGQILSALNDREGSGGGQIDKQYEGVDIGSVANQSDRAFAPMRDFFKKQLEEALYGDLKTASNNTTDHAVFLKIYETRVSKNLVETITGFCMDVSPAVMGSGNGSRSYKLGTETGTGPDSRFDFRKQHGEMLSQAATAGNVWKTCASDIRFICTYKGDTCPPQQSYSEIAASVASSGSGSSAPASASSGPAVQAPACANDDATQKEACKVEAAMKEARAALLAAAQLKTAYGSAFGGGDSFQGLANAKVYTGGGTAGEKSIDEVATLTSKDVETNYGAGASAEATRLAQACGAAAQTAAGGSGSATSSSGAASTGFDAEACKRYVMTQEKAKDAEAGITEYAMRSKVMQERMKKDLISDTTGQNLAKYLKETGLSDSEIQAIQTDDAKKQKAVAGILANYEAQRQQVILDMQDKIKNKKTAQGNTFDKDSVATAANAIQAELSSEPDRYKRVTNYSNLVTVFLQKSGSGPGGISFSAGASVEKELANSALDPNTNSAIRTNLASQGAGGGGGSQQAQQSLLKGEELNSLLLDLK